MAFRSEVLDNLSIVTCHDGQLVIIPSEHEPDIALTEGLLEVFETELADKKNPIPKPDYKAEIYRG
ncbi:MAG: hypothetical protein L3J71_02840 [Victivallaceae bacterium]|nr:hypothetical protein [Victivallaceae bacterium]